MTESPCVVLIGADGAGKSSVLRDLATRLPHWRIASTDDTFLGESHRLIADLRGRLATDVLPGLGTTYSPEFLACFLQTAVVYLRDLLRERDPATPLLMDSYYYKILAKCRLAGVDENPMYSWWRSFPRPHAVVHLDVSPRTAWLRSGRGARLNPLEHFGERPDWPAFDSYQKGLRKLMLEEVQDLPVTVVPEQPSVARASNAVLGVLPR
ncbi:AAA family ATPase [Streptomyces sp. PT12]|uniref:AAA family ATPase n=1 Tax=Streptomyces sp. PT12 TaxID=1510197 RepID=UPI000DE27772|nr:AAA family ATPase [Streptomyces sp. PT12]RBM06234.1 hypothetical protein DEH69_26570 [Streptomyces sp. PT12]